MATRAKGRVRSNTAKDAAKGREKRLANLKPFAKGFDPRRNLKGRPKSHDELRDLIRDIAAQELPNAGGLTYLQVMIIAMLASPQSRDHVAILEHGWGKVPDQIKADLTHHGPLPVAAVDMAQALKPILAKETDGE